MQYHRTKWLYYNRFLGGAHSFFLPFFTNLCFLVKHLMQSKGYERERERGDCRSLRRIVKAIKCSCGGRPSRSAACDTPVRKFMRLFLAWLFTLDSRRFTAHNDRCCLATAGNEVGNRTKLQTTDCHFGLLLPLFLSSLLVRASGSECYRQVHFTQPKNRQIKYTNGAYITCMQYIPPLQK